MTFIFRLFIYLERHPDNLIYKCIVNKLKINNLKKEPETTLNTLEVETQKLKVERRY